MVATGFKNEEDRWSGPAASILFLFKIKKKKWIMYPTVIYVMLNQWSTQTLVLFLFTVSSAFFGSLFFGPVSYQCVLLRWPLYPTDFETITANGICWPSDLSSSNEEEIRVMLMQLWLKVAPGWCPVAQKTNRRMRLRQSETVYRDLPPRRHSGSRCCTWILFWADSPQE